MDINSYFETKHCDAENVFKDEQHDTINIATKNEPLEISSYNVVSKSSTWLVRYAERFYEQHLFEEAYRFSRMVSKLLNL